MLQDRHAGVPREVAERELDVGAGGVAAGVDDAGAAVRALPAQRHHAVDAVERHAEAHEVGDAVGRLVREDVRRLRVDEPGAGVDRVLVVQLGASSEPTAAAMPPWAYFVLASSMLPLVSTSTLPCSRAISAAYSPAMPEPTMM